MKPLLNLAAIGALCALLLAGAHRFTAGDIRANRDAHAWRVAFDLAGAEFSTEGLRWNGGCLELPDGVRLERSSVQGYAGEIEFLAAFRTEPDGTHAVAGVRITRHRETPGLGDFIDTVRSPWIHQFSHSAPEEVDAVTGATITSQAVKRGVSALLLPGTEPSHPAGRCPDPAGHALFPTPVETAANAPPDPPELQPNGKHKLGSSNPGESGSQQTPASRPEAAVPQAQRAAPLTEAAAPARGHGSLYWRRSPGTPVKLSKSNDLSAFRLAAW